MEPVLDEHAARERMSAAPELLRARAKLSARRTFFQGV